MCGIFAYFGTETELSSLVFEGLKGLEYRGYDSWGIAVRTQGGLKIHKEQGMLPKEFPGSISGSLGIGHTRWATTGKVNKINAHPHTDCSGRIVVVHNGLVENFASLRAEVLDTGHNLVSDTDTEVIAHLIEKLLAEGFTLDGAVCDVGARLQGLNSFVVMHTELQAIAAYKNGSPMYVGKSEEAWLIASDAYVLRPHVVRVLRVADEEVIHLHNAEFVLKGTKGVSTFTEREECLQLEEREIETSDSGNYSTFLEAEVAAQPKVLRRIADTLSDEFAEFHKFLQQGEVLWCSGCGSAYHAALLAEVFFLNAPNLRVRAVYAHELHLWRQAVRKSDRILLMSQSGETIDVLGVAKTMRKEGIAVAAMINVPGSSLQYECDLALQLRAGQERCVLSTKAFAAKLAYLHLLASDNIINAKQEIRECAAAIDLALSGAIQSQVKQLASLLKSKEHLFILGSGLFYGLALEAALKIKEVSYIHAEGILCGELKHGTLALFEPGTVAILLVPDKNSEAYQRTLIAGDEIRARGARVIFLGGEVFDVAGDEAIFLGKSNKMSLLFGVLAVVQMLSLELAQQRGCHPDKPRNLAKSVTVR